MVIVSLGVAGLTAVLFWYLGLVGLASLLSVIVDFVLGVDFKCQPTAAYRVPAKWHSQRGIFFWLE